MSNKHYAYVYSINQLEVWKKEDSLMQWQDVKLTNGNKLCNDLVGSQLRVVIPSKKKCGY